MPSRKPCPRPRSLTVILRPSVIFEGSGNLSGVPKFGSSLPAVTRQSTSSPSALRLPPLLPSRQPVMVSRLRRGERRAFPRRWGLTLLVPFALPPSGTLGEVPSSQEQGILHKVEDASPTPASCWALAARRSWIGLAGILSRLPRNGAGIPYPFIFVGPSAA